MSGRSALMIVPTLCVGMPHWTLRVRFARDAERPGLHSHAERGNDQRGGNWPQAPARPLSSTSRLPSSSATGSAASVLSTSR
ncbi:hypothetical protein AWU82_28310 [Pseudomonas glycinae]|uniref:Secreted protein n=1 Tax=Pseudomonas glycinae TaxID=1785145 RepID=A0ABM6QHH2_9PSED|nr:hypothetical protein AWU82_28310 [Pseudomonas glycinae]